MQDEIDDVLFARIARARPTPPPDLAAAVAARVGARTPAMRVAIVLAAMTALAAILLVALPESSPELATNPGSDAALRPAGPVDAGSLDARALDAPSRIEPLQRARELADALHAGDLAVAERMFRTPFLQVTCAKQQPTARDAAAVREVVGCIAADSTVKDVAPNEPRAASLYEALETARVAATNADQHERRAVASALTALARDHALVNVTFMKWPKKNEPGGSAPTLEIIVAIDAWGHIDAILSYAALAVID